MNIQTLRKFSTYSTCPHLKNDVVMNSHNLCLSVLSNKFQGQIQVWADLALPHPLLAAKSCKFSLFWGYISQFPPPPQIDTRPPLFANPGSGPELTNHNSLSWRSGNLCTHCGRPRKSPHMGSVRFKLCFIYVARENARSSINETLMVATCQTGGGGGTQVRFW